MNRDCTTCKSFLSYRDEYLDDLEPAEYGNCYSVESPYNYFSYQKNEVTIGEGFSCEFYCKKITQTPKEDETI